jgi:phospholipid/cholesterol/gamma-HCH transport system substrate-binding protein
MKKENGFLWKLGMFVVIGLVLLVSTIYFIGKRQNMFGLTFQLKAKFTTVSGLKLGNNVRFSGINVGTVNNIEILSDTSVLVEAVIKKEVQKFIKTNALASIGSDGLMGDKVLMISTGIPDSGIVYTPIKDSSFIATKSAVEMDDIMFSVKSSVDNVDIITTELAEFTYKLNNGKGALTKLLTDEKFGNKLDATMTNLQTGTKGLNETIYAAQHNFLLKGFFNKKKRAEAKKKEEAAKKLEEEKQKRKG